MNKSKNNYAFIDSQNLNLGIQKMGWKLDWRKFREMLANEYGVTKAFMFIGYMQENEFLYEQMHDLGYLIVLKPTVESSNKDSNEPRTQTPEKGRNNKPQEPEKKTVKGNIDADLVLYAMKEMPNYNKAIIVSGDGDFFSLAEYLIAEKRLLHIMTPNWQYSSLLKEFESHILRLDQMRRELAYRTFRNNRQPKDKSQAKK